MELKPGYKQTEVGVIPEDWEIVPFAELFAFRNGVNADKASYGQGVRFINVLEPITYTHIHGPEVTGQVTLPESVISSYAVHMGDVLFNRTSETQDEVALAATYLGTERVVFGGFVIRGRPLNKRLNPVYSGYALRASVIRSQIVPMGQGAVRANVGQQNLGLVLAPIPTLPEQRAIATALSDVDALLDGLDRLIAKKRNLKQAAMQQLLTGETRLPGFEGEWEVKRLREIVDCAPSGTYGVERQSPTLLPMPVATTAQISNDDRWNGKIMQTRFFTSEQVATYGVSVGDLVVVKSSGSAASIQSGKMVLIDRSLAGAFLFSNFLMRLRPKAIFPNFLYFFLTSNRIKSMLPSLCEASTYPNIRINEYLEIDIPVPETKEQTAIATVLSDMDAEIAVLEQRRDKTKDLKLTMMQELLTGKTRLVATSRTTV
ncbi:hypothetical protein B4O97_00885 [Marispirochaeta aestuarii]|uniref:Type I restriction modification DNA specificity domain-containing protein n=1 Tax=Marispirochaeta aestuarii TaxID=1963862 RepID=A0A1Y1S483_9SPIO|nr:restriction endonuclease subunit S [Marispirochaeta aestuarii]ORC38344.1 hypothetical protein B4O97_00885 [Marispirochaeta aestuarii]